MLLGIALLFIFLHQPPEPPESSRPLRLAPGPLAGSRPLAPDPDLRPLTNSDLKRVLVLVLVFQPIVWSIVRSVGRDLTAL